MSKDDRSEVNPFTGKKHYDTVNDDEFLAESYNYYYNEVNQYELLDNTPQGQMVFNISSRLINTVNDYLMKIGRYDYVEDYYDWEVHLVNSGTVNACCFPGGKIIVYAGILSVMEYEDELAFVLSHEISHALLDHSRTSASVDNTKNSISNATRIGSFALDMLGFQGAGELTRAAVNVADFGSHYFLTKPWGRDHELEADTLGLKLAYMAGFNMSIVPDFWQKFSEGNSNDFDFFSTHPSDSKRIAVMRESLHELSEESDFYARPLLDKTPKAKREFKANNYIPNTMPQTQPSNTAASFNATNNEVNCCPKCGSKVEKSDNFCMQCGHNLHEKKNTCPNCGSQVNNEDKFCMNCGKRL